MIFSEIFKLHNEKKLLKMIAGAIIGAASVIGIVYILQNVFTDIQLNALMDLFPDGNLNLGIVNLNNFNANENVNIMGFVYNSYYLQLFVCVFAMLLMHNDINNGSIVFLITRGKSYFQIYLTKVFVIYVGVFAVNILYLMTAYVATKALAMSCTIDVKKFILLLVIETIVLCIEAVFFVNVYLVFRNILVAVIVLIMAVMGMPGLLEIVASVLGSESIEYLWIGNFATNIYDASSSALLVLVLYVVLYGFVSSVCGYKCFRKFEKYL